MAHNETSAGKSGRRSGAGIFFLILLLLLLGSAAFLYYSVVRAPLDTDDPVKLAASAPMDAGQRFSFSPEDGTVQVKMDTADIWSLILAHAGNDFQELINEELTAYGLSLSGCAIHMDEEGFRLDLELYYNGKLRLVAAVPCTLEISGSRFCLTPTGLKLGVIPLPVGGLLSSLKLEYDISLPVLSEVTQITFVPDAVMLTGVMEPDVRMLAGGEDTLYRAALFSDSLQSLTDVLLNPQGYNALLSHLQQNPGDVEELYRRLFLLADSGVTGEYLEIRHGMTQRFFPGIDFDAIAREQQTLDGELTLLSRTLEQFFTHVANSYNDKQFRLTGGVFYLNWKPFRADQVGGGQYDALFHVLDPESFFLILVDAKDGFIRKTSSFYRIADKNQQFTRDVDFNKTYILGCVLRSVNGEPYLLYEMEIKLDNSYVRKIKIQPLTEADVSALQVPGKFGVWTD